MIIVVLLTLLWALWIIIAWRQHRAARICSIVPISLLPNQSAIRRTVHDKLERRMRTGGRHASARRSSWSAIL